MNNKKVALITGASRGIGLSVAKSLIKAGYIVLIASKDAVKLNKALLEIESLGGKGDAYSFDVSDYEQVRHTIQNIITKYGQIDVLFNNAGVLDLGTIEISEQKIKNTLRINLDGAIFVAQEVAKHPVTNEEVWFNQAHLFHISSLDKEDRDTLISAVGNDAMPRNSYYGDGEEIGEDELNHIKEVYDTERIVFPWQKGDVMLLDNILMAHSRYPFTGTRKVVVAMG